MLKAHRSTGDNHWVISRRLAPAVALALVVAAPAAAHAADVVTPRNGDVVGSQPQFTFDFAEGSASVELSKSASVKTAGDDVGAFVDVAGGDFLLVGPTYGFAAGVAEPWTGRINAGRYFWHAKLSAFDAGISDVLTPVRTFTVRDEAAIFEGWSASAVRGRTVDSCSRTLVQGRIAWSDNEARPTARYTVNVSTMDGKRTGQIKGTFEPFETPRFSKVICTKATKIKLTAELRDGTHTTRGPKKTITVRRS
jgi:opacity protein-like surface antigen